MVCFELHDCVVKVFSLDADMVVSIIELFGGHTHCAHCTNIYTFPFQLNYHVTIMMTINNSIKRYKCNGIHQNIYTFSVTSNNLTTQQTKMWYSRIS